MRFLLFFGLYFWCFQVAAQESTYRSFKVNGKVHTFKTSLVTTYPYDVELRTANGETVNSSKVLAKNGKPTVLLFWMTTCVPCQYELHNINQKFAAWKKEADFNFYAISIDLSEHSDRFQAHVQKRQWQFPAYHDYKRTFRRLMPNGLNGLPQTFLLDKNGDIVYHKRKYRMGDEDLLFEEIQVLLAQD